jgi:N-glycosylase/DNA lyase
MITSKEELAKKYEKLRPAIEKRLLEFKQAGAGNAKTIFAELSFCLLTPQSKARSAHSAIKSLLRGDLLFSGAPPQIARP